MRNMSFSLTTEQFRNKSKTVTRRTGWLFLKPGDRIMGCEKCQGIKAGELVRLGAIEIVNVTREMLYEITKPDVIAEGFPELSPDEFVSMFCDHMNVSLNTEVTRIEFKYL